MFDVCDLGVVDYEDALCQQREILESRIKGIVTDTIILLEHNPVVTLGRIAQESSIIDKDFFKKNNIPIITSGRGGEVTYHSPGQLVIYPILDLRKKKRDIAYYISFLEKTVVNSLNRIGISAERSSKRRGVWVQGKKIAFIGISLKKWVTYHGVAINVSNDITPFFHLHPCGEKDIEVVSVKELSGNSKNMGEIKKIFVDQFKEDLKIEYKIKTKGQRPFAFGE